MADAVNKKSLIINRDAAKSIKLDAAYIRSLLTQSPVETASPKTDIQDLFSKNCLQGCHGQQVTKPVDFSLSVFDLDDSGPVATESILDDNLKSFKVDDLQTEIEGIVETEDLNTRFAEKFDTTKPSVAELALEEMIRLGTPYSELRVVLDASYTEDDLEAYKLGLEALREERLNANLGEMIESIRAKTKSEGCVDEELLLDRSLVNLTDDPKYLFKYFPALAKKLEQGTLEDESLSCEIRALASEVKGAYVGKGSEISLSDARYQRFKKKKKLDKSSKFILAASWLSTRPDSEFAMDSKSDLEAFPGKIYSVNGVFDRRRGIDEDDHAVVPNFKNKNDLVIAAHEFIHHRDRRSNYDSLLKNLKSSTKTLDGFLQNGNGVQGLVQLRHKFGVNLQEGLIPCDAIFCVDKQKLASKLELLAYGDSAFLQGNKEFKEYASEVKLLDYDINFYEALTRYYGVDPLAD